MKRSKRPKIVVVENLGLYDDQISRLKKLGTLKTYGSNESLKSADDWLKRCRGYDIICTGTLGLKEKIYELSNVFISLPFVGIDWIDKDIIKKRKIIVANSPGCNKDAVSEWIIGMMINLLRNLPKYIKTKDKIILEKRDSGLFGRNVTILGNGHIGKKVEMICKSLGMNVLHFLRGEDLIRSVKDAEIIIDCLGSNPTTHDLLDKKFFHSLREGSYFITVTGRKIVDYDAMIDALDRGTLNGAATDCGDIQVGNTKDKFYIKLSKHPKILVTPHIAYRTDVTARVANDMMIDNIEAFLKGKPKNIVR